MGGESFSKLVWPKTLKMYMWCVYGMASNGKSVKCWCGNSKVGMAMATPAIRHAPPMITIHCRVTLQVMTHDSLTLTICTANGVLVVCHLQSPVNHMHWS